MHNSVIYLCTLLLSGAVAVIATNNDENCKAFKDLNDLCGSHTFQSVKPILNYVKQLQTEKLNNNWEIKEEEMNKMGEQIQQLQLQIAEGKYKDVLIAALQNAVSSKDIHIKDLQEAMAKEDILKNFINEVHELKDKLLITNKNNELTAEIQSKDDTVKNLQKEMQEYKNQLEIKKKTIDESANEIIQMQIKLNENHDVIMKQNETIQQKEQELSKLEENPNSCLTFGDSNYVHDIKLHNFKTFPVLCNRGWTVIQQRINGVENFTRNWETYRNGFGSFTGDFFLGLEKIHRLTKYQPHDLYIYMEAFKVDDYKNLKFFARYDNFRIAGEEDKYRLLSLGTYSGNEGIDAFRLSENKQFSTIDRDNDEWPRGSCASLRFGGWWFAESDVDYCDSCNLNGKYFKEQVNDKSFNSWTHWVSLKTIKMLIRRRAQ